jgi:CheY-like chemotaxis protein
MGDGLSILLVEDDTDTAVLLRELLAIAGHHVVMADSCAGALATIAMFQFDCYLLDIGLPDGDGCDLLRQLLAHRAVPAAAVTGYDTPQDRTRYVAAGFSDVLFKPFSMEDLHQTIARFGETPRPPSQPPPFDQLKADGEWLGN